MSSLLVNRKKGNSCYARSTWEPANDDVRCWGCYSARACLPWARPHQMLAVFPQEGENRPSSKKPWGAPELGQVGIDLERNQPVSSR